MSDWAFTVDVSRCTGCHACRVACIDRADLPDGLDLLRVEPREGGRYPRPTLEYRVAHCWHCRSAPCAAACPTGALHVAEGGWVRLEADECSGCGACLEACPFDALVQLPDGRVKKCDGCADEVARGLPPTCVRGCPMRALGWGQAQAAPQGKAVEAPDARVREAGARVVYLVRGRDPSLRSG